jgi:signal transduction histidine kinase
MLNNLRNKFQLETYGILSGLVIAFFVSIFGFREINRQSEIEKVNYVKVQYKTLVEQNKLKIKILNNLIRTDESLLRSVALKDQEYVLSTLERHIGESLLDISILYNNNYTVFGNGAKPGRFGTENEFSNIIRDNEYKLPITTLTSRNGVLKLIHISQIESINGPLGFLVTGINLEKNFVNSIPTMPNHFPYIQMENTLVESDEQLRVERTQILAKIVVAVQIENAQFLIKISSKPFWQDYRVIGFVMFMACFIASSYYILRNRKEVNMTFQDLDFLSGEFESIAAGDYERDFEALHSENLGSLVESFEKMCISLKDKVETISTHNSDLMIEVDVGKEDLRQNLMEKERLLRLIIHDLCNPLSLVKINHRILTKKFPSDDVLYNKYMENIFRATNGMIQIVDNVKKFTSISDGKLEVKKEKISVQEILKDVTFYFSRKIQEKDIKIAITPELDDLDVFIVGDKSVVTHQILSNIISNSIKFSNHGSCIDVVVSDQREMIRFELTDYGVGIPKDKISEIFRDDVSTSTIGTDGEEGTGFGMPLVLAFTTRLGGTVNLRSTFIDDSPESHGTTFIIELPKAA